MKKIFINFVFFIIFALPLQTLSASEEDEVKGSFSKYMNALLHHDGATVAQLISKETFKKTDQFKDLALYGTSQDLEELNSYELFSVLALRQRIEPQQLIKMSAKEITQLTYDKGWNSRKAAETISALNEKISQKVNITSNTTSTLTLYLDNKELPPPFPFVKEEGIWKIDQASLFPHQNKNLEIFIEKQGKTKKETLLQMLEKATGKKPSDKIWEAPYSKEE